MMECNLVTITKHIYINACYSRTRMVKSDVPRESNLILRYQLDIAVVEMTRFVVGSIFDKQSE